ncbi:MAG: D-glycero-beta-D-manno-heptose-7-phosphate kinase [Syntrophaceae bacterium]|nr:D-glycero-beta-D-manno-heptose-7-phosphate kinase [Syntrophaceae bacterium]
MGEQQILQRILNKFPEVRILVIGDVMMDRFVWGKVSRISPEAPVPVVVVDHEDFRLGGAANVVNNIQSLGGRGILCGVVGDDEMGQRVLKELAQKKIETMGIFMEPGRQTTVKTRIFANQQQVVRIDREKTDHMKVVTFRNVSKFLFDKMKECDGVILSDYGKGLLSRKLIRAIIRKANEWEKLVMVDPKFKDYSVYRGATVITPNTKEASEASGIAITDEWSLKRAGEKLLKRLRCHALVITRGEEGMAIFESHQEPHTVGTIAKEVFDVTGAGDTVIGTMALALAAGASIKRAAGLANYAAGIVVGKMGTATATQKELVEVIKERF